MIKSKILAGVAIMSVSLFQLGCSVFGVRSEETPKYEVLTSDGDKEIRSYSSYIVAKTRVKGEFKAVQNEAFRILAGYIFGDNKTKQTISMTAPVVQSEAQSEKISMTAPVVQAASDDGWVMSFMMPSKYKMSDLPTPNDPRIEFEEIPPQVFAVIRYSGRGRDVDNQKKAVELSEWLSGKSDYKSIAKPSYAGFDPPWALPFLRRNEMMIQLEKKN